MSFLNQFWKSLRATLRPSEWIPRRVFPDERISRFIFSRRYMKVAKGRVSASAFVPPESPRVISVYRTAQCEEEKIWLIGKIFVEGRRKDRRTICGRADLQAASVSEEELTVTPTLFPHPRHANIGGWPDDDALIMAKAQALADASTPHACP